MPAASHDITIEQGATFNLSMRFGTETAPGSGIIATGRDFTGYTFRAQVRKEQRTTSLAMATITSEDTDGGITGDASGNVVLVWPDEVTDGVSEDGYWDLKCYAPDGTEERLMKGRATCDPAVTLDP